MINLNEATRNQSKNKSKKGANYKDTSKGKNRYDRRLRSKLLSSVKNFNSIDMNKLFKEGNLEVAVDVQGETDVYSVTITFGDVLDQLHKLLKENNNKLDRRIIMKSIMRSFNSADVRFRCTCADWQYRFGYFATKNDLIVGKKETRPSDITNPDDTLGAGCKHVNLVLADSSWVIRVASVVYNYINYIEKHSERLYKKVIYPAIYENEFEEENPQLDLDIEDNDTLNTDKETIDKANKTAREKNWFKKDNEYRFKPRDKQVEFDLDSLDNEEE